MLWNITRIYKPDTGAGRAAALQAHRDYLAAKKACLVMSCQLQTDNGEQAIGTLFVVKADTRAEAQAFLDNDPFAKAGLMASVTITRMRKGIWNPETMEGA